MAHLPLLLGAYYYTWYGIGEQWSLYPRPWQPVLGEYKSIDQSVIRKHHDWGKQAGIDFFAVSWGGDGTRSAMHKKDQPVVGHCKIIKDGNTHTKPVCDDGGPKHSQVYSIEGWREPAQWWGSSGDIDAVIQANLDLEDGIPLALQYEVRDVLGVGEGQGRVDLSYGNNPEILMHHLMYAAETLFTHPHYYKIDGRPVVFLYTMRDFDNFVAPLSAALQAVEKRLGTKLFLIGDVVWWGAHRGLPWADFQRVGIDAVTGYNLYDSGQPEKMGVDHFFHAATTYLAFEEMATRHGIQMMPHVSPGYDDRKMRGGSRPAMDRQEGATYVKAWAALRWFLRCHNGSRPMLMVNSFNEWHEGTQIEPSVEFNDSFIHWTRELKDSISWSGAGEGDVPRDVDSQGCPSMESFSRYACPPP